MSLPAPTLGLPSPYFTSQPTRWTALQRVTCYSALSQHNNAQASALRPTLHPTSCSLCCSAAPASEGCIALCTVHRMMGTKPPTVNRQLIKQPAEMHCSSASIHHAEERLSTCMCAMNVSHHQLSKPVQNLMKWRFWAPIALCRAQLTHSQPCNMHKQCPRSAHSTPPLSAGPVCRCVRQELEVQGPMPTLRAQLRCRLTIC